MTSPYERLMAEAIPVRPTPPEPGTSSPWTPEQQAQHWADLAEALDGWTYNRDKRRPRLRLVKPDTDTQAA
jgi:hypothetical protein